jgi:hypothetical protein
VRHFSLGHRLQPIRQVRRQALVQAKSRAIQRPIFFSGSRGAKPCSRSLRVFAKGVNEKNVGQEVRLVIYFGPHRENLKHRVPGAENK